MVNHPNRSRAVKYRRVTALSADNFGWTAVLWDGQMMGYVRKAGDRWDAKSAGNNEPPLTFMTRSRATAWLMTGATWENTAA